MMVQPSLLLWKTAGWFIRSNPGSGLAVVFGRIHEAPFPFPRQTPKIHRYTPGLSDRLREYHRDPDDNSVLAAH